MARPGPHSKDGAARTIVTTRFRGGGGHIRKHVKRLRPRADHPPGAWKRVAVGIPQPPGCGPDIRAAPSSLRRLQGDGRLTAHQRGVDHDRVVGVSKPHLYYYFDHKEDLYRALPERAMNTWAADIDALDLTGDLRTVLRDYIHRKIDFSRDHPSLSKIYATEIISGAPHIGSFIDSVSTPQLLAKVAMAEEWAAAGLVRPISPADLFFCIWAMTQAYADFSDQMALMKKKDRLDETDYVAAKATIVQLVFGGLGLPLD